MRAIRSYIRDILREARLLESEGVNLPQGIATSLEDVTITSPMYHDDASLQKSATYDVWLQANYKNICADVDFVFQNYGFTSSTTGFNISEEDLWRQAEASLYLLAKDRNDMLTNSMPFPYRYALFIIAWENGEQTPLTALEDYINGVHEFYEFMIKSVIPDPASGRARETDVDDSVVTTASDGTPGEVTIPDKIHRILDSKLGIAAVGVIALAAGVPQLVPASKWLLGKLSLGTAKLAGSKLASALTPKFLETAAGEVVAYATKRSDPAAVREFDDAFEFLATFGDQPAYAPVIKKMLPLSDLVGTLGYPSGKGLLKQPMGLEYRAFSDNLPVAWSNMQSAQKQIVDALKDLKKKATFEIPARDGTQGSSFKIAGGGNHPLVQEVDRNIDELIKVFEDANFNRELLRDALNQAASTGAKAAPTKETIKSALDNIGPSALSNPTQAPQAPSYDAGLVDQFFRDPLGTITKGNASSQGAQVRSTVDFTKAIGDYKAATSEVGENLVEAVRIKYSGRTTAQLDSTSTPLTGNLADKAAQLWARVPDIRKNVQWYKYRLMTGIWWTIAAASATLRSYLGFQIIVGGGTEEDKLVDQQWVLRNMLDGKIRKESADSWTNIRGLGRFSSMQFDVGELDIDLNNLVAKTDALMNNYGSNVNSVPTEVVNDILLAADQAITTGGDAMPWAIPPFESYLPISNAQQKAQEIRSGVPSEEEPADVEESEPPDRPFDGR